MPYSANLPTDSSFSFYNPFEFENRQRYPIIFDKTPDCAPGESPAAESYYTCDLIPTCKETIPYCDPLPRCNPGQSPISCEENANMERFSNKNDCDKQYNNVINWLGWQGVNSDPLTIYAELCEKKHDGSINEDYYQMPLITVNCRHIPECSDGEVPVEKPLDLYLQCGKWYTEQRPSTTPPPAIRLNPAKNSLLVTAPPNGYHRTNAKNLRLHYCPERTVRNRNSPKIAGLVLR